MIMLPQSVVLVLLSATLPNVLEFADWLGRIRGGTTIHVCQTYKRPVPLEHFLYTGCDTQTRSNLYLVVDKDGKFSREGYREAVDSLTKPKKVSKKGQDPGAVAAAGKSGENFDPSEIARMEAKQKPKSQYTGGKVNTPGRQTYKPKESEGYNRGNMTDTTVWTGLIRMLQERELTPVIVFCFSRAKITNLVHCLDSIDLLNKSEKNEVIVFLRAAIGNRLKACDKQLSQVLLVRSLAVRGIAIHHAGMLPLLKEVVELLFQRGLVRILFATETFAMGVNMPARCVIFTAIQKHDGNRRRPLTAGEYTQMAGRAGRRGLDSTGTVIIMSNNYEASVMPTDLQIQQMLLGQATKLTSQFKVTYSIILYLHRGNLQTPQELISRSFMYASDLRFERQWKRQLKYLQETVHSTTVHKPSSSHSLAPGVVSSKTAPVAISSGADDAVPLSYSQVRCPAHPLDSEASALSPCVGQIASYYLSCCRWRDLTYACAASSANQPLSALSKIFSPGRLLLLQLSTESVAPAAKSMSGASLGANAGSTCVPNWVTLGVVLDLTKASIDVVVSENSPIARSHVTLAILTWELPASPIADCTGAIGGSQAEEDVLESGELRHQAFTPFPPHLMPNYCPKSVEESKSRLVYVSEVPLTAVLAVFSNTVEVGNSKAYAETISNELTWFRQQQMASAEGCFVIHKKRGDSPDRKKQVCLLAATNEALFNCAQKRLSGGIEALPFWQHLGLEGPEVDEWTALTEELSRQPDASDGTHRLSSAPPPDCRDLVGHLSLAHRTTRRRWAIGRLSEKLKMNRGALLADYEARVFILEELGFLDKTTRSGCLTRKGMAACEFQQMEVLLAEVLFDGSITHLPPADIAALLSCFVCESGMGGGSSVPQGTNASLPLSNPLAPRVTIVNQEDINTPTSTQKHPLDEIPLPTVPEHLQSAVREMLKKADQLMRLQVEFQVDDPEADTRLNPALVGATYAWACGQPFSAIINLTTFAEGHLLRALQRLDELLRHVCNACRGLGDQALASRINDAHVAIHRDMVCAPSLYVAEELPLPPTNEHSVEV
uniref:DSHCT domain-containing protein n=1 Tax=Mesocestoides corti TaxID=53468 RepID=A0A5K3FIR5_MESCO